jgi:hypothetical protein
MTIEEFNTLTDKEKKELLIDAKKLTEREDDVAKYEIFQIDSFFVEVSRSVTYKFRKILNTYSSKDLPLRFAAYGFTSKK